MELHHLRHFVAVAEELHFGRAAARLGMAQPPLSQSIRRLESGLGVQLLERSRRHVTLTPAGSVLLDEARRILAQVQLAERLAKRAALSGVRRLRVGFTPIAMFAALPQALKEFRSRWPGVEVQLEERASAPQIEALLGAEQDLGILLRYGEGIPGLTVRVLERVRTVAALPAGHPLARRRQIDLTELSKESFVTHDPELNPDAHTAMNAACRAAAFAPTVAQHANQTYTILGLVANGVGVALVGENARHMAVRGVALVPVAGVPEDLNPQTVLAWAPAAASPALTSFVQLFETIHGRGERTAIQPPPP